jgi:hypothetical protein
LDEEVPMSPFQSAIDTLVFERSSQFQSKKICCYLDAEVSRWTSPIVLSNDRLLAAQALQLLMKLDRELRVARADWNQDRFRRVMKARSKAVARVRRRWNSLNPAPAVGLGKLCRRYHANLAGYLYDPRETAVTD